MPNFSKKDKWDASAVFRTIPLATSAPSPLQENVSCMRKPWPTCRRMDQAHCGTFLLGSCLSSAFLLLQAASNLAARSLKNSYAASIMLSVSTLLLASEFVLIFS